MGCAIGVVKALVFLFNLIFVLCGLGIIIYGIVLKIQYKDDLSIAPVVFGIVVFIIAFFGCCGAIKESRCMLITYAVILIIMFMIFLVFGMVAIFIMAENSEGHLRCKNELQSDLYNYERGIDSEKIENSQSKYECCGVDGFGDYKSSILPPSCCETNKTDCKKGNEDVFQRGCVQVCDFFYWVLQVLGIAVIIIGLVELTGAICALCLASSIQSQWRRGTYA